MGRKTKVVNGIEYEVCLFPLEVLSVGQVDHVGTHYNSYAIDINGADTGKNIAYAPCSMTKFASIDYGNTVWYRSNNEVFRADGTIGYVTIMVVHCNDDDFVNNGFNTLTSVAQGQAFYMEGVKGVSAGNHIHIEVAWGISDDLYIYLDNNNPENSNYGLKNSCPVWEFLIRKLIQSQKNSVYCKNCGTRCFCVHFLFLSP